MTLRGGMVRAKLNLLLEQERPLSSGRYLMAGAAVEGEDHSTSSM